MKKDITKIVLTGGPCAGKTTALARIVEHFSGMGYYVLTIPEAATLFSQSGVDFLTTNKKLFIESERQLMEFQLEIENRLECIARQSEQPSLIVCDRGTMDIRAYMADETWDSLLETMGKTVVELRDARYAAVIHMATAAKGAELFYNLGNNAARKETPEQARAIDDRLMNAWTGHPHLRVVGNDCTFEEKINRVLTEISHVLGIPQPIEIERKYLVEKIGEIPNSNTSEIYQTYLTPINGQERRLRMRGENGHNVYFLTTKIHITSDRRYELERQIDENQYRELLNEANPEKSTIHKLRSCFLWKDQYFELDEFIEPRLDHLLLEIEDAEDTSSIQFPPFLRIIEDVTEKPEYYNSNIAVNRYLRIETAFSLRGFNTFGIDSQTMCFINLCSQNDYWMFAKNNSYKDVPQFILGCGSNVILPDLYEGYIIHPANSEITLLEKKDGHYYVVAGAGTRWLDFVNHCIKNQWYGLENLASIPGSVGAAPVQNIGAYGKEAKDVIHRVHCYDFTDGSDRWIEAADCGFGYRWSNFKGKWKNRYIIDRVVFKLDEQFIPDLSYKALVNALAERNIDHPTARQLADIITAVRDSKLPNPDEIGNAGSFFKNPIVDNELYESLRTDYPDIVAFPTDDGRHKLAAGWLIERCGWKGRTMGRVGVYEKQALVLVNRGGCTSKDVRRLADTIIADVKNRFGVELECEAIFV